MTTTNLGRVQGGSFFFADATSDTTVNKTDLAPSTIPPLVGDHIVFSNGDIRKITVVGSTTVTCDTVSANLKGPQGNAGPGVPSGGTAGQVLVKSSTTDYDTEWQTPVTGGSKQLIQTTKTHRKVWKMLPLGNDLLYGLAAEVVRYVSNQYKPGIWSDGENIYFSYGNGVDYVLDKTTLIWTAKTWTGASYSTFRGNNIWSDGENIYFSDYNNSYNCVLDTSTDTWSTKTWNGLTKIASKDVWSDGINIYYSNGANQYVLDKATSTWTVKTWSRPDAMNNNAFHGNYICSVGEDIYLLRNALSFKLDKSTSTWTETTMPSLADGVWTDGTNIYSDSGSATYIFDKDISNFRQITHWSLYSTQYFYGSAVFSDGENIYVVSNPGENGYKLVGVNINVRSEMLIK